MKNTYIKITQTALMTALIAVMAQIILPFFAVPMTLQTFAVCLAGCILGYAYGTISVAVYLTIGAIGIPVFAGFQGSIGILFGPTGGFLIGFLPLAFLCGISAKRNPLAILFPIVGTLICHALGVTVFSHQSGNTLFSSFLLSSAPFLIKDLLSCFLAKLLAAKLSKYRYFNKN